MARRIRRKRTTVWAYLDGKKLVDVVHVYCNGIYQLSTDDMVEVVRECRKLQKHGYVKEDIVIFRDGHVFAVQF